MPSAQHGFSLIEQVAVVGIALVLSGAAIPGFTRQVARARVASATSALADAIRQARQEAMLSGAPTVVCPGESRIDCKGGHWSDGWFGAYARGWPVRALGATFHAGRSHGITIVASPGRTHLRFHTDGSARETNQTITLCVEGKATGAQTIIVALNGRVRQIDATPANATRCAGE